MRITESKLRSIIRQVIAEGYQPEPSAYLDSWLRDGMVDSCSELFNERCKYFPYSTRRPNDGSSLSLIGRGRQEIGPAFLRVIGDKVFITGSGLSTSEIKRLISYMKDNCNILKNERICDGVFMNGQKIELGEYEP